MEETKRQELQYEATLKNWEISVTEERKEQRELDKSILSLSGGAIVLSISFIKEIAPKPTCSALIILSWCFFGLAVISVLSSFWSSAAASRLQRKVNANDAHATTDRNAFNGLTKVLNIAGGISFIAALVLLVIFASVNFK